MSKEGDHRNEQTIGGVGIERWIGERVQQIVADNRFSVMTLLCDLLKQDEVNPDTSLHDTFESWTFDALAETVRNKESDCFGLARMLQTQLGSRGVNADIFPFSTEGLLAEEQAAQVLRNIGSVGVLARTTEDHIIFVDPGFALTHPLTLTEEQPKSSVQFDGREFFAEADFQGQTGRLEVFSPHFPKKSIGFRMENIPPGEISDLQKKYFRVRPTMPCDRFNREGEKIAGLKVQLLHNKVTIFLNNEMREIPFTEWETTDVSDVAHALGIEPTTLFERVQTIISYAPRIRGLWVDQLRALYAAKHYPALEAVVRSGERMMQEGYVGSGVVAMIINKKNEILLYKVPKTREKPFIGRVTGQLNGLVETASPDEDVSKNLERGIEEELGADPESFTIRSYRETSYGPTNQKVLARCFVLLWDGDPNAQFHFSDADEGVEWKWISMEKVLGYELEPNMRPIIETHMLENLL